MNNKKVKIAVDAMGGDNAPQAIVEGAVYACAAYDIEIILVGREDTIKKELQKHNTSNLSLTILNAPEIVGMGDNPLDVVRKKKNSSIPVAIEALRDQKADAFFSAGNSGAVVASALFGLKRLKNVDRPAIASIMPSLKGHVILTDAGANNSCNVSHLVQFAIMSSVFCKYFLKKPTPRVGILSNGEEESKGTDITRKTHLLLKESNLNYIGYVEGRDVFKGSVDVVVCDGFTGNVLLKVSEGAAECLGKALKEEIEKSFLSRIGYLLARRSFSNFKQRFDYAEYGGAPLLGVNGTVIVGHGRSSSMAIKNAIRSAKEFVQTKVTYHLLNDLEVSEDLLTIGKKPSLLDKVLKHEIIFKKPDRES
jgi:glycerol-3-phosphate acyltransferase PlsX